MYTEYYSVVYSHINLYPNTLTKSYTHTHVRSPNEAASIRWILQWWNRNTTLTQTHTRIICLLHSPVRNTINKSLCMYRSTCVCLCGVAVAHAYRSHRSYCARAHRPINHNSFMIATYRTARQPECVRERDREGERERMREVNTRQQTPGMWARTCGNPIACWAERAFI